MPFASDKQRRFLFENHPRIAKQFAAETPAQPVAKYQNLLGRLQGSQPHSLKLDAPPHVNIGESLAKEEKRIKY